MKATPSYVFLLLAFICTSAFTANAEQQLMSKANQLKAIQSELSAEVMVVGTHHFSEEVLSEDNQKSVIHLTNAFARFRPTKIFLEWEPERQAMTDDSFSKYVEGKLSIAEKYNEVYQLGFRLAKQLGHKQVYLFDNQTPYIGSLQDFSFDSLMQTAKQQDQGFYNRHEAQIIETFELNQALLKKQPLYNQIALRNSPQAQRINALRMHAYENRIDIAESWVGPDWLGRWYRRNIRMSSIVLKHTEPGDRLLIIVGDNHKWLLDRLFAEMPEFTVQSSWKHLLSNTGDSSPR